MRRTFDTSLADLVEVRREGHRWRLSVCHFTGDVLTTTVLHVDGDFRETVLKLVDRTLLTMDLVAPTGSWTKHETSWSAPLVPVAELLGAKRVLI